MMESRMSGRALAALALAAALAAAAPPAHAGLRCGNDLVSPGDTTAEVVLACGEPLLRELVGTREEGGEKVLVERWTYERGPGKLLKFLTFEGGVLVSVEDGARQ